MRTGFKRGIRAIGIGLGALYVLYVASISLFLNTSIFGSVAEMTDPEKTRITFGGAWSLVPGIVHFRVAHVDIREPAVDLDITLMGASVRVDLRQLREKRVDLGDLHVRETTVDIRSKTPPPDVEPVYPSKAARVAAITEEERIHLASRWTIDAHHVLLPNLSRITLDGRKLRASRIFVEGAFLLQPGTRCEIYPSRLEIENGNWNDEITGIDLAADVRFHRFRKHWLSGSEVFRYFDGRLRGRAETNGLKFLNVTLRSLGSNPYGLDGGGVAGKKTSIEAEVAVLGGRIQPGSAVRTEKSEIGIGGARFTATGTGTILWRAGKEDSTLKVDLANAKAKVHLGNGRIEGIVKRVEADARISGLDFTNAFTGIAANLRVAGGFFSGASGDDYRFDARVNGTLSARAGEPVRGVASGASPFEVMIDSSDFAIPGFGRIAGSGRLAMEVRPIDLRAERVELPRLDVVYRGKIDGKHPVGVRVKSRRASRTFAGDENRWSGEARVRVEPLDGLLDQLRDRKKISALVRAGLSATRMTTDVNWSIEGRDTRLAIRDLDSNGIWSGDGELQSEPTGPGGSSTLTADFDGKVLGFPVDVDVKETKRP
ncbi:MAG: hypothetical protein JST04_02905 [Bdellovibrionales bacterium]|nr:hypothetical protein [Bdellovibrionales bacterium]